MRTETAAPFGTEERVLVAALAESVAALWRQLGDEAAAQRVARIAIALSVLADVPADTILRLGLVVGICLPLLHVIPISLITRYRLTREAHAEIRCALSRRQAGSG